MQKFKSHPVLTIVMIITLLLGITFILSDYSSSAVIFFRIIACFLIGAEVLNYLANKDRMSILDFIDCCINLVVGIITLFAREMVLSIILGLLVLSVPLVLIYKSPYKKQSFYRHLPRIIIGVLLCFNSSFFDSFLFITFGVLLIAYSIYLCIIILFSKPQEVFTYYHYNEVEKRIRRDYDYVDGKSEERIINEK